MAISLVHIINVRVHGCVWANYTCELGTRALHQWPPLTRSTSLSGSATLPMTQCLENLSKSTTDSNSVRLWASRKGISKLKRSSKTGFWVFLFTPVWREFLWSGSRLILTYGLEWAISCRVPSQLSGSGRSRASMTRTPKFPLMRSYLVGWKMYNR